jgi:hypothetical protein
MTRKSKAKKPDEILGEMAETFRERGKIYGDNWKLIGGVLQAFFPNGLYVATSRNWNMFHLWFMILVKMTRLSVSEFKHKDSAHDIAVYAAMLENLIEEDDEKLDI